MKDSQKYSKYTTRSFLEDVDDNIHYTEKKNSTTGTTKSMKN